MGWNVEHERDDETWFKGENKMEGTVAYLLQPSLKRPRNFREPVGLMTQPDS